MSRHQRPQRPETRAQQEQSFHQKLWPTGLPKQQQLRIGRKRRHRRKQERGRRGNRQPAPRKATAASTFAHEVRFISHNN